MFKKSIACFLLICFPVLIASASMAENGYVIVSAQKSFLSAESRLKDFAKKAEDSRMQSAMYGMGLGVLYLALGSSGLGSSYGSNYSTVYYGMGIGLSVLGLRSLFYPTELENNYNQARKMPSATVEERAFREKFAEDSLRKGAEEATQGRMIISAVFGIFGLASMNTYGILYVGLGAMSYLMKSDIEKAYDEYVVDKEEFVKSQPVLQITQPLTIEAVTEQATSEIK